MNLPGACLPLPSRSNRGFVRYDLYILVAVIAIALAMVLPQAHKHGPKGALVAVLLLVAALTALMGGLFAITWVIELAGQPGSGGRGGTFRWVGHLLQFAIFGAMASLVGAGLLTWHGLSRATVDILETTLWVLGGATGCIAFQRLGPARFWPTFRRLCLTLLGSFLGGILGILGPGNWGVDIGILVPLLVFVILVAMGRIIPRKEERTPPTTPPLPG